MTIHLLSGFLGSGKTTAIQQAAYSLLQQDKRVGVITNDQGIRLVDGGLFKSLGLPERQVVNGCFCCNYNELDANIQSLTTMYNTEIIFAESVGSCTDIVATVLKPLLAFYPSADVSFSTFADVRLLQMILTGKHSFDGNVEYIYLKQLEEAAIIVVSKIDLVTADVLHEIKEMMNKKYGDKILLYQDSYNKDNIQQWLQVLDNKNKELTSLDINYDIYAAGEAGLAWLDESVEIYSATNNAWHHAQELINLLYKKISEHPFAMGHLKCLVNDTMKVSFTHADESPVQLPDTPASSVTLLINIRVQAAPQQIRRLVTSTLKEAEENTGCKILVKNMDAFQPGYPTPVHRM